MSESPDIPPRRASRAPRWVMAVVCGAMGALIFHFYGNAARGYIDTHSLFYWWGRQWFDPASEAQHGPVIVLVAVWLFVRNLRRSFGRPLPTEEGERSPPERADKAGGVAGWMMSAALALHVLAYAMQQTRLSILAWLLFLAGILRLAGGKRWSDAAFFPLGFLALAIPVGFLQPLGFYLRLAVSQSAELALHAFDVGIVRNGTQLFAPDGHFQYDVAAACSGVRSLVALFALSLLVGYLRLPSAWARGLLVLATVPFAFAGNFVRILAIVLAGQHFGQSAGERVHDYSGFMVFVVVLGLLLAMVPALARWSGGVGQGQADGTAESDRGGGTRPRGARASQRAQPSRQVQGAGPVEAGPVGPPRSTSAQLTKEWIILLLVVLLGLASIACIETIDARAPAIDAGVRIAPNGVDPASLPEFIGTEWIGQRIDVTAVEREVLPPDTGYSRRNYVSLEDRSRQVFVSIVLSGRDRSSIHRPELCVVGQGWNIVDREERSLHLGLNHELPVTLLRIERELTGRGGERRTVSCWLAYWFVGRDVQVPSHAGMIWRSSLDRLLHFRADRWAYVIAQAPLTAGEADGLAQMEEVLGAVWPEMRRAAVEDRGSR